MVNPESLDPSDGTKNTQGLCCSFPIILHLYSILFEIQRREKKKFLIETKNLRHHHAWTLTLHGFLLTWATTLVNWGLQCGFAPSECLLGCWLHAVTQQERAYTSTFWKDSVISFLDGEGNGRFPSAVSLSEFKSFKKKKKIRVSTKFGSKVKVV